MSNYDFRVYPLMGNPNCCLMIIAGTFFLQPIAEGNCDVVVPDKLQKVENLHFAWCGYIGFRARCYVKEGFLRRNSLVTL